MRIRSIVLGSMVGAWLASPWPSMAQQTLAKGELEPGVTLEVTKLQKLPTAEVVELRFDLVNDKAKDVDLKGRGAGLYFLENIQLLDLDNAVAYLQGQTSGRTLASNFPAGDAGAVKAGERRSYWVWFKAPPPAVKKLALQLPGMPPIVDIPVAR